MDELTKLAIKYGTDKWSQKHHYTPVYYEMFKDKRNEVKKVLEIGPAEGAGLFMLRDFFPNAMIYGAEIDQERVDKLQGLDRIKVFKCDQSKMSDLKNFIDFDKDYIDIVIDDGSHKTSDQFFSACYLLNSGLGLGTYIIEDVHETDLAELINKSFDYQLNALVQECGDRYDDNLIII